MKRVLLVIALTLVLAEPAAAVTVEEGRIKYSVSGSYTSTGTARLVCTPEGSFDDVNIVYPVTDRVTFSSGTGSYAYSGAVGRSVFFSPYKEKRPKLKVTASRVGRPPIRCSDSQGSGDCGSRSQSGRVWAAFDGAHGVRRRVNLLVDFNDSRGSTLDDPFKQCNGPDAFVAWWADAVGSRARAFNFQDGALNFPTNRAFYKRKTWNLSGSVTKTFRESGASGPATVKFSLKLRARRLVKLRYQQGHRPR